jgi:hypothetical protein
MILKLCKSTWYMDPSIQVLELKHQDPVPRKLIWERGVPAFSFSGLRTGRID